MHSIRIHCVIGLIISLFHRMGFWHRGDKATIKETRIKLFYCIYQSLFALSLMVGAFKCEKIGEAIFLADASIGNALLSVKLWLLIGKQNEILDLLRRVCVFSIHNGDDHHRFNGTLRRFVKFVIVFVIASVVAASLAAVALSFVGSEKSLFVKIGFPWDYENDDVAFWLDFAFIVTETVLAMIIIVVFVIVWYLLLICSLRYELLGSELKIMGRLGERMGGKRKMTETQMHAKFFEDLQMSINAHVHLTELTKDKESLFSDLFFIQFGISALCICGSTYCLAFDIGDNLLERLMYLLVFLYYIAEIFMITYFGNEIMLSSGRLSYSLFESNWYDQPQSTKNCILVFGEYLKQPQVLLIGKLYTLTLETFTMILNSAYSMFNILQSFQ